MAEGGSALFEFLFVSFFTLLGASTYRIVFGHSQILPFHINLFAFNGIMEGIFGFVVFFAFPTWVFGYNTKRLNFPLLAWLVAVSSFGITSFFYNNLPDKSLGKQMHAFGWMIYHFFFCIYSHVPYPRRPLWIRGIIACLHALLSFGFAEYLSTYSFWNYPRDILLLHSSSGIQLIVWN